MIYDILSLLVVVVEFDGLVNPLDIVSVVSRISDGSVDRCNIITVSIVVGGWGVIQLR